MKRPYETMIVFDGTLPDETLQKEQSQIEEFLKQNASYEKTDVWGKRTLAYAIGKKKLGYYCLFIFEGEGGIVGAIERHIKLNEKVLRHLTTVRDVKNDAARVAFFEQKEKAAAEAAAAPAAAATAAPAAATSEPAATAAAASEPAAPAAPTSSAAAEKPETEPAIEEAPEKE